jgi:hypothetical protein
LVSVSGDSEMKKKKKKKEKKKYPKIPRFQEEGSG